MDHTFSRETDFCTRCDMSREEYVDFGGVCVEADNLVSFRHRKCLQWMDAMMARIAELSDDKMEWLSDAIKKLNKEV